MGGAHSPLYTAPHPAAPRPGDGAGPLRPPQPFRAGTRPLSLPSRVGGRGGPRHTGWAARPKPQPGMLCRGPTTGGRPRSLGREGVGWGRRKSLRRSRRNQGWVPGAPMRAGSVAPVLGLPSLLFPPSPGVAPGNSACRRRRETHLPRTWQAGAPQTREPVATPRHGGRHSQWAPLSQACAANPAALRSPGTLEALANGHERKAGAAAWPPTPSFTTSQEAGRGWLARAPEGWDAGSGPGGRARTGGCGRGGARRGAAAAALWPRSPARVGFRGRPAGAALLVPVTRSSPAGVQGCLGGSAGEMGPQADGGVTGNFGRLAWPWPGSGRAGGDKLGPPGKDYPAGRQPERNSEGGGGGMIKMLSVPAGCWAIPGAEISGNGSSFGAAEPPFPLKCALFTLRISRFSLYVLFASTLTLIPLEWFSASPMDSECLKGRNCVVFIPVIPSDWDCLKNEVRRSMLELWWMLLKSVQQVLWWSPIVSPFPFGSLECLKNPNWFPLPARAVSEAFFTKRI